MEDEVIYYCEDHDNADLATLSEYFGHPDDVARDFLSELGESEIIKANSISFRLRNIAITAIIIAVFLVLGLRIFITYKQQQVLDGHYVEAITYEGEVTFDVMDSTYATDVFYSEVDVPNDN